MRRVMIISSLRSVLLCFLFTFLANCLNSDSNFIPRISIVTSIYKGDLYIEGHRASVTSGDLFVHGHTDILDSRNLFIHGHKIVSASGDLFIYGQKSIAQYTGTKEKTKVKINTLQLCVESELILRHYNHIQKDNKRWFFSSVDSIINQIEKLKI